MNTEYNKRSFLNICVTILGQIITFSCGLIIPRLFIGTFGSEINGMLSTINQLFVYIALLEAGVGAATIQALYKPVAQGDKNEINSILSATDHFYKKTGLLYFSAVLCLSILFPYIITTDVPHETIIGYTVLHGFSGTLTFFFQGKYLLLLTVEGKYYIASAVATIVSIFSSLAKVFVIICGRGIIDLQIVLLLINFLVTIFYFLYIKRNYKWIDLKKIPNYKAISQRNSVLVHQVSNLIFNNTDTLFLSYFCGLKIVSIYVVYNLFFDLISTFISNINSGISFRLGQIYNSTKEKYKLVYDVYETYYTTLSFALYNICFIFILPFMRLYTSGFVDQDKYLLPLLPLFFSIIKILVSGRAPSGFTTSYAGHFQQNNLPAILESIINVSVSIFAIHHWGIYGALIGTIVALSYRSIQMIIYSNVKLLNRSPWKTYRIWIVDTFIFAFFALISYFINIDMSNYLLLISWACVYSFVILLTYLVFISLVNIKQFKALVTMIRTNCRLRIGSI